MSPLNTIVNNVKTLRSGAKILASLSNSEYNHIPEPYFTASLGKHFRHILDHYTCFLNGLSEGHIDYDSRARISNIETDAQFAIEVMNQIIVQLETLGLILINERNFSGKTIKVCLCTSTEDRPTFPVGSSIERELIFLHGHTTHHFALIAAILKLQNCSIDNQFGVAPSTLAYEEQEQIQKKCAP